MPQVLNAEETRKTYFGEKAQVYDRENEHTDKRYRERAAVREFLSRVPPVASVLDIPVGTGTFLSLYHELGIDFAGMDVSEEMLAQARAKAPEAPIANGDILSIRVCSRTFDAVVCIRLMALIDQDSMIKAVQEMGRVARDRIIISLYTGPVQERHNRHFVHLESAFAEAALSRGFVETAHRFVNDRGYRVALLERCG